MFTHRHLVQFYETDLMGIVHHSNYLRFFEETRVAWAHAKGLIDYQKPESAAHFAVIATQVRHLRPCKFGDFLEIELQAKAEKARIIFEYRLRVGHEVRATGRTEHVPLNSDLKLMRLPSDMKQILEKETWIETWLSNS